MIVDKNTLYTDFAASERYINADEVNRIMNAAVVAKYGDNGFFTLTIGALLDGMHGEFRPMYDANGLTVFDVYRVRAFSVWVRDFIGLVERFTLKPTAKQIGYTNGCVKMSFDESVYVFLREYFGLHRFDDVLDLTVADYLLAKKDTFNRMVVERNQMQKS